MTGIISVARRVEFRSAENRTISQNIPSWYQSEFEGREGTAQRESNWTRGSEEMRRRTKVNCACSEIFDVVASKLVERRVHGDRSYVKVGISMYHSRGHKQNQAFGCIA